jgi:hypothetical protein
MSRPLLIAVGFGAVGLFLLGLIWLTSNSDREDRQKLFAEKCLAAHYSREQCEFFLLVSEGANAKAASDAIFTAAVHAATN